MLDCAIFQQILYIVFVCSFFNYGNQYLPVFIKRGDNLKNNTISVLGAGNMATAIIKGIVSSQVCDPGDIFIYDLIEDKVDLLCELGCKKSKDACDCVRSGRIIVLAVKPQNFQQLLSDIKDICSEDNIFVSIAAGISTDYIRSELGFAAMVIRVLPNTPMLYGAGASTMCCTDNVDADDMAFVRSIFDKCGVTEYIEESLMNASIAIHSSSPAFVFLFAKCIAEGAKEYGIDYDTAIKLFSKTLSGAAKMIENSGMSCDELIKMVASPGGTTLAALNSFYNDDFSGTIKRAMRACTDRAFQLGK